MAIFHMSFSNISAGKGRSAIASAAYRSGENLALMLDLRTDFSLPCKLIAEEHFLYDSIFTRI